MAISFSVESGRQNLGVVAYSCLSRLWFALESLNDISKIEEAHIDDVSDDVAQSWHAAKSGKKGALNFFAQARKLFEIRTILNSADEAVSLRLWK